MATNRDGPSDHDTGSERGIQLKPEHSALVTAFVVRVTIRSSVGSSNRTIVCAQRLGCRAHLEFDLTRVVNRRMVNPRRRREQIRVLRDRGLP